MSNYIDDEDELKGKVIEKVVVSWNKILIKFTDGSVTGFEASASYNSVDLNWYKPKGHDLVELEIKTKEEYEANTKDKQERQEKIAKQWRKEQYEKLKKEFEDEHV
jgi:hypothetical protein